MRMKSAAATAVIAAAAVAVTTATAGAAPQPAPPASEVRYEVTRNGDSAVVRIDGGKIEQIDSQLVVWDAADQPIAAIPLRYQIDDMAYPVAARIDGTTATLTPSRDGGRRAEPVSQAQVITVEQAAEQVGELFVPRDAQALGVFAQRAAIGAAVSAVFGAVLGAGVGCLVGAAAGAAISSPLIALLLPFVGATIAGCVLGMATLGAVGSMAGVVLAGGPITLFSAIQYFSTILAPCPPELAYCKDPAQIPAPVPAE
ncbi:hypothetical protein ACFXNW_19180 [Nocardia sp. NPDC059180]|uniref:hypothetical protein n=1 Tax=Nocardia sp. NPDC059180 TaxID=3346761 RepID=UPI0036B4C4CC